MGFEVFLLEDSKENASDHQAGEVTDETCASHDNTPAEGEGAEVCGGALDFLEDDVARDFEEDVGDEDCGTMVS